MTVLLAEVHDATVGVRVLDVGVRDVVLCACREAPERERSAAREASERHHSGPQTPVWASDHSGGGQCQRPWPHSNNPRVISPASASQASFSVASEPLEVTEGRRAGHPGADSSPRTPWAARTEVWTGMAPSTRPVETGTLVGFSPNEDGGERAVGRRGPSPAARKTRGHGRTDVLRGDDDHCVGVAALEKVERDEQRFGGRIEPGPYGQRRPEQPEGDRALARCEIRRRRREPARLHARSPALTQSTIEGLVVFQRGRGRADDDAGPAARQRREPQKRARDRGDGRSRQRVDARALNLCASRAPIRPCADRLQCESRRPTRAARRSANELPRGTSRGTVADDPDERTRPRSLPRTRPIASARDLRDRARFARAVERALRDRDLTPPRTPPGSMHVVAHRRQRRDGLERGARAQCVSDHRFERMHDDRSNAVPENSGERPRFGRVVERSSRRVSADELDRGRWEKAAASARGAASSAARARPRCRQADPGRSLLNGVARGAPKPPTYPSNSWLSPPRLRAARAKSTARLLPSGGPCRRVPGTKRSGANRARRAE